MKTNDEVPELGMSGATGKSSDGPLEEWLAAQRVTLSERQLDAVKGYIVMNLLPVAPTPQASSEIRERVRRLAESWPHESSVKVAAIVGSDQTVGWCADRTGRYAIQCKRCELTAALVPSRQGAGGK